MLLLGIYPMETKTGSHKNFYMFTAALFIMAQT